MFLNKILTLIHFVLMLFYDSTNYKGDISFKFLDIYMGIVVSLITIVDIIIKKLFKVNNSTFAVRKY